MGLYHHDVITCVECLICKVELSYFNVPDLKMGDHIRVPRYCGLYYHHGVCLGENNIIHCTGEILNGFTSCATKLPSQVRIDKLEDFVGNDGAPQIVQHIELVRPDVLFLLGDHTYSLMHNNCEHFANSLDTSCKTKTKSYQVIRVTIMVVSMLGLVCSPHLLTLVAIYAYAQCRCWI